MPVPDEAKGTVSEMLTVWRTLHVEMEWTILKADGAQVTVIEDQFLPFFLVGDGVVKEGSVLDPRLIQASDDDSSVSTSGFWVVYVQAAFQSDETADHDPNGESRAEAGVTLEGTDRFGTLVYLETIGDSVLWGNAGVEQCSAGTLVHELGHQFGLDHEADGIMFPGCLFAPRYFTAVDLDQIRKKGAQ